MRHDWLDADGRFLGGAFPLPLDVPFTRGIARAAGLSAYDVGWLCSRGLVRPVLHGVHVAAQTPDDLALRAAAVALVLPDTAVVADRTAAWLHGVEILPRSALVVAPPLDVVHVDDTRVRRGQVDGRRRGLTEDDVTRIRGLAVTTPLRTALDLGRLLWRPDALGALDGFVRAGVPLGDLRDELPRFRGYRGVCQLRLLVPLADGAAESVAESGLRLRWHEAGLPAPVLQHWVLDEEGVPVCRLDLADPAVRYAAEYDGTAFHTSPQDAEHDVRRRTWLAARGWTVGVFTYEDLYERGADARVRLVREYAAARRACAAWAPGRSA